MENNKLLIGAQFSYKDEMNRVVDDQIELYVVRDITFKQLLNGIGFGLLRLRMEKPEEYTNMCDTYLFCAKQISQDERAWFTNICLSSFCGSIINGRTGSGGTTNVSCADLSKKICDLGFTTSSKIIFDATGEKEHFGPFNTSNVIEAFNPLKSKQIFFPEYNISTRQLWKFDNSPVNIIPPTDPPKKSQRHLLKQLLPSLIPLALMLGVRLFSDSGGWQMILLSLGMGATSAVMAFLTWREQNKEFEENLKNWKQRYQDYIDRTIQTIINRQKKDVEKLHELYPDVKRLINHDVYSLNRNLYSRAPQDEDFLSFRVGISDRVLSKFEIKGEKREVVFSDAGYQFQRDSSGNERLRLFPREEVTNHQNVFNLCDLPNNISERYRYLERAPLLYSLKNKGALGIVDKGVDYVDSGAKYLLSQMIFELCYYHSPDQLQFVMFFKGETDRRAMDQALAQYKYLPHFRGLFEDKSQFVFDTKSAGTVLSNLFKIMNERKMEKNDFSKEPHVVVIVFDDHGLKEHAFAEFLPKAPIAGQEYVNDLGLTFVFATQHKEYLPAYCDDVIAFDDGGVTLIPRSNIRDVVPITLSDACWGYLAQEKGGLSKEFVDGYRALLQASNFLSAIYYARIAQNEKVPSAVSFFNILTDCRHEMVSFIKTNWGCGSKKTVSGVTSGLRVPVGKNSTGMTYLDLHEKADGPHMLVAGTTGSGKTETIISYLLGLCMHFRPDELNLLLVDMKGGGFTKRIGDLPHVVGTVTDVDGDENGTGAEYMLGRFLHSMKAEIKRRKILFNKLHVDNIDDYIQAYESIEDYISSKGFSEEEANKIRTEARDPDSKLSHLILVVDEFTELKRFSNENSDIDFISQITTIARIGRSLGFHIILISQNIEGAITEDIRVNVNARLCLKVATKQASKEMIGTELAGLSTMPGNGRAYLLVGNGSKFEYFQSGYSGASIHDDVPTEMILASKNGPYSVFFNSKKDIKQEEEQQKKTQMEVVMKAICNVYESEKNSITKPHMVFTKPLPHCIALGGAGRIIELD
jgi:S-DNA-T family DNA segregation ATPase FtsK/SpoIIIE